ncbi:MAG: maleylpyruvate isomerase N-terminal domain-containing protein [Anaerolineales bacterium]
MTSADRDILLRRLDDTRSKIEEYLPNIDARKEIYPGWTIKEMLAHMTGWDEATIDSLRAHVIGRPPSVPAIHSMDEYNALTVSSRKGLNYDQTLKEWRLTRQVLRTTIEQMPEDKFIGLIIVPWGDKATVTYLVDMFRDHEDEHARDISKWLQNPEKPLEKEGS